MNVVGNRKHTVLFAVSIVSLFLMSQQAISFPNKLQVLVFSGCLGFVLVLTVVCLFWGLDFLTTLPLSHTFTRSLSLLTMSLSCVIGLLAPSLTSHHVSLICYRLTLSLSHSLSLSLSLSFFLTLLWTSCLLSSINRSFTLISPSSINHWILRAGIRHLVDSRLPNLPSERGKGQAGSTESLYSDLDINYGKSYKVRVYLVHTSVNASCLSLDQPGPIPGVSLTHDARYPPSERAKGQQLSWPAYLDMNYGSPSRLVPVYFCQSTMSAWSGAHLWCPVDSRRPQSSLGKSYRAARVWRLVDYCSPWHELR